MAELTPLSQAPGEGAAGTGPAELAGPADLASALPQLLISFLERRYLSSLQPSQWDLRVPDDDGIRPLLREITAVPRPDPADAGTGAMASVLSAAHTPGQAVVFCAHGDGRRHRLFLGGRRLPGRAPAGRHAGSTQDFLNMQDAVLRAQLPGIGTGPVLRLDGSELPGLTGFLSTAPALAAVTGIPAPPGGRASRLLQGIDQVAAAAGTQRYALMIVAEPLPAAELDAAIDKLRDLKGESHRLVRRTVSESQTESSSTTSARRDPDEGRTGPLLPDVLTGFAAFCSVAGLLFPAAGALTSLAGPAMYAGNMARMRTLAQAPGTTVSAGQTQGSGFSTSAELLNATAEACEKLIDRHLDRLETARSGGWWRMSVYVAAESAGALAAVTGALRAAASGTTSTLDPVRVIDAPSWLLRPAILRGAAVSLSPTVPGVHHPLGETFDSLATCATTDELSVLTALPRREVAGLPMTVTARFALSAPPPAADSVGIGQLLDPSGREIGEVTLSAAALNRHVFITGTTGYGKTTTATRLLTQAWRELGVPFLVIEPVKREYRRLRSVPGLRVYGIDDRDVLPLRLNPFAPVAGVSLMRHIDLLKAVFSASFPMFAGMSYVLEEALLETYTDWGWDLRSSANRALGSRPSAADLAALSPSLADLHDKIEVVLGRRRYGAEVHQNMGAALRSRVRSLMLGAKGEALNCRRGIPAASLFTQPCVIELRNLGDEDDRSFVMALLLCQLYEYAEARQGDGSGRLLHLTLIEEAHRLLRAPRPGGGMESADAQAKAVTMFTDLLAEMRAYGEGFIVADQIPAKLTPDVIKNSNVKIVHRLTAPDDRAAVAASAGMTESQSAHLVALSPGTAVVHDSDIASAVLVRVASCTAEPDPATEPAATASGHPRDESYLRRNGGCARCAAPCTFLDEVSESSDEASLDQALSEFFAQLGGEDEVAWRAWSAWRVRFGGGAGAVYCAASQAGYRWLGRLAAARAAAALTGPGAAHLPPAEIIGQDRAARAVGSLVFAWAGARELDAQTRQALTDARDGIRAALTGRPPRELPGCGECPARCQYLQTVGQAPPSVGTAAGHRISAATAPDTRLRSLRELLRQHSALTAGLAPEEERDLLYCLVTVSAARVGADAEDLQRALRSEASS